jgi:Flp pilus assembly pilin Flp
VNNKRRHHEEGQGLIEYALILTLVSLGAIVALSLLATPIKGLYQDVTDTLAGGPQLAENTDSDSPLDQGENQNDNSDEDDGSDKQTICHVIGGKHGTPQTMEVPPSAVPGHLGHGDSMGPCP